MTRAITATLALTLVAGAAHAQNALGGGRALDNGLSTQPGGRVNPTASDYQSIVRYNTNAGNALNGPGLDINALNARGSLATSPNRPYVRIPAQDRAYTDPTYADRLGPAALAGYGTLGAALGSRPSTLIDRVATLEAGYLPNGALTSNVTLPQGTTADDYRRSPEPYVGMVYDNRGNAMLARASSLRGVTFVPPSAPPSVSAPGDAAKIGSAVVYNRVIDELRRASTVPLTNPNRVDTSTSIAANQAPVNTASNTSATTPATTPSSTDTTKPPATRPTDIANPLNPQRQSGTPGTQPGTGTGTDTSTATGTSPDATKYDPQAALKRLRERLSPTPSGPTPNRPTALTPDPSNSAATPALTEEDIAALKQMSIKLDTLVPQGSTDAQATDAYTRMGQESLAAERYGLADQMFQSALARSADNTLAAAGRVNAVMGLGLLMTGAGDLREFYVEHPEMIPVRFESALLMPRSRADRLAAMLTEDIDKTDGPTIPNAGLALAYLGRQFDNQAWLTKGLATMAKQSKDDKQATVLLEILQKVWTNAAPATAPQTPASK